MAKNHEQDIGTTLSQEGEIAEHSDREEQEGKYCHTTSGKWGKKYRKNGKLTERYYLHELVQLQEELVKLQYWIRERGLKVAILFEGRDAAGKGGVVKRITERTNPRVIRVVALGIPTEREKSQWYFERWSSHLPAAGEMALFDRSWYTRAITEHVMGFCTEEQYREFLRSCPQYERMLIRSGIILLKYWFSVSDQEQERRFRQRATDPKRRWKLSPMDIESSRRWWDYTKAYDHMLQATDTPEAPWFRVPADDKRRARLNCISHLLSQIDYEHLPYTPPEAGKPHKAKPGTPKVLNFRHEVPQIF